MLYDYAPAAQALSDFRILTSRSSFPVNCTFTFPNLKGRFRVSSTGEVQLLLVNKQKRFECPLRVETETENTVKVLPTVSLYFHPPGDCKPQFNPETDKNVAREIAVEFTGKGIKVRIENNQKAGDCRILRYERPQAARVIKEFTRRTGTGIGAEKNLEVSTFTR